MARSSPGEEPRSREPRALGEVLRVVTGPMRRGLQLGRLVKEWDRVAGEPLAGQTRPVALTAEGLVIKAATAAWAAQVRFLAEDLRGRANEALGSQQVRAVRVVVGPVEGPRGHGGDGSG